MDSSKVKLLIASAHAQRDVYLRNGKNFTRNYTDREREALLSIGNFLESYHYIDNQAVTDNLRNNGIKIFLDSGAYSAFTKGIKIDLKAYCNYVIKNRDIIDTYEGITTVMCLDQIGNDQGSWDNQCMMEDAGLQPIPCFHHADKDRYLEAYLDKGYKFIALGGMSNARSNVRLKLWLDRIWSKYLCDETGMPKLMVHGLGVTSVGLMRRYPWYSVDSSTWVQAALFGGIYIRGHGVTTLSKESPQRKNDGKHLFTMNAPIRDKIISRIESDGFDVERLRSSQLARSLYNMWSFNETAKEITRTRGWIFKPDYYDLI